MRLEWHLLTTPGLLALQRAAQATHQLDRSEGNYGNFVYSPRGTLKLQIIAIMQKKLEKVSPSHIGKLSRCSIVPLSNYLIWVRVEEPHIPRVLFDEVAPKRSLPRWTASHKKRVQPERNNKI